MMKRFCLPFALLMAAACSSGSPANTGKTPAVSLPKAADRAVYSIRITPQAADRNTVLRVLPEGFNLPDARVDWIINGSVVSSGYSFTPSNVKKGDRIQAKATVQGREVLSDSIVIGNTVPELTRVKLMPEVFRSGDNLYVEAEAADPDGDPVEIRYEWTKNGEPAGSEKTIGAQLRRGDRISIRITPCDATGCGRSVVLNREIRNMPPMFSKESPYSIDGSLFTQTVRATDPDGDTLTYALKSGPEGMTINPSTGEVSWEVPAEYTGKASFTVAVTDGKGGGAVQTYNVSIR